MLYGGSQSGKTFLILRNMFIRALKVPSMHCIFRKHFIHARRSICFNSVPRLLPLCFPGVDIKLNKQDWFYTFPNDSVIWVSGLDDKERVEAILGNSFSTLFFEECSQMMYSSVETAITRLSEDNNLRKMAYFAENPPNKKHWSYNLFIRGVNPEDQNPLINPEEYDCMLMNPVDNKANLPKEYFNFLGNMSRRKQKRFVEGIFLDDAEGALWTTKDIDNNRISFEYFEKLVWGNLQYIIVGVDPAVSNKPESDEHGIIVAGKDFNGEYYVFDDLTRRGTPLQWGNEVCQAYHDWSANKVVAEKNQGGDLVESNIQNVDAGVPVELVHACRGKVVRAEPIVSLYEKGQVHHVEVLPELEDEMTSWNPLEDNWSPNRIDALVWALTGLRGKTAVESGYVSGLM